MANKYTVTLQLEQAQFLNFIDSVGPVVGQLVVTVEAQGMPAGPDWNEQPGQEVPASAPAPKTRPARGSKVNDTILAALQNSTLTVKQLKEALEHADLSAGSLSTGIAALTRDNKIVRVSEGVYALAETDQLDQAA